MEKYIQYSSIDFSQEPSFIAWVRDKSNSDDHDWQQWLTQHPEKAQEITEAQRIVQSISFESGPIPFQLEDKLWSNIDKATTGESAKTQAVPRRKILRLLPYGIAAAVALFAIMNISNYDTAYQTSLAEVEEIVLPDGSEVLVNADSKISYDKDSWAKNRNIKLSGEAFFEVKKGSRFNVETDYGNVEVLGTSFNVYARNKILNVNCETGKVSVSTSAKQTILTPNQSVSISKGIHQSNDVSKQYSRSNWTSGIFIYKKAALMDVIAEIERQFGITVKMDASLNSKEYTGSFNKKDKDTALSEVLWPLDLKFNQEGKTVFISQ